MPLFPAIFSRPRGLAGYLESALLPSRGGLHGPVACWPGPDYKSDDGKYLDIVGGNNGTPTSVTETAGPTINQQTARAWGFGGDGGIDCGVTTHDPSGAISVGIWANVTNPDATVFKFLMNITKSASSRLGIAVYAGTCRAAYYNGATFYTCMGPITAGWHYIVASKPTGNYAPKLYIDGVLQTGTGGANPDAVAGTTIGYRKSDANTRLIGSLALASIHARALSADEIQYLYLAAQKGT